MARYPDPMLCMARYGRSTRPHPPSLGRRQSAHSLLSLMTIATFAAAVGFSCGEDDDAAGTAGSGAGGSGSGAAGGSCEDPTAGLSPCEGATLEVTPTFRSLGLDVSFAADTSPQTRIDPWFATNGCFLPGHRLSAVEDSWYAGSLVELDAGTSHELRLVVTGAGPSCALSATAVTRVDELDMAASQTVHVAPNGDDGAGDGSSGAPYRTIARSLQEAAAGVRIELHEGVYYEQVELTVGGDEGRPLVLAGALGENAVIDGSDPDFAPATWSDVGDGIYRTPLGYAAARAYHDGEHLYRYDSIECLQTLCALGTDAGYLHSTDGFFYVRLPGDLSPAGEDIAVSRFAQGIVSNHDHVQLRNLEIRHFGGSSECGVHLAGASYNVVADCRIHHNVGGVLLSDGASFNVIQDSEFYETPLGDTSRFPWNTGKPGAYERGAIVMASSSQTFGNVFRRNSVHDMFEGAHLNNPADGPPATHLDVYENSFADIVDDCIETDGAGSNIRIFDNRFERSLVGISLAPAFPGPTYVFRNQVVDYEHKDRLLLEGGEVVVDTWRGRCLKFNVGGDEVTRNVFVYHNTCASTAWHVNGLDISGPGHWRDVVFRNNIFAGGYYGLVVDVPENPIDLDFNLYFFPADGGFAYWGELPLADLAALQAETGMAADGMIADPEFVDGPAGDFTLRAGSAAVDSGVDISGFNRAPLGPGPDRGAIESR